MRTRAQFIRFVAVGILATLVNYSVFYLALHLFGKDHYILSSCIGFIAGVIVGYIPNKIWSFQAKNAHKKNAFKYLLVYATSFFLSILMLHVLVEILSLDARIANLIMIATLTVFNFLGAKFFVFSNYTK